MKNDVVSKGDIDRSGRESGKAASVTQFANGDKRGVAKGGKQEGSAGRGWEVWQEEVNLVMGGHGRVVSKSDMERRREEAFVVIGGTHRKKVVGGTGIKDGSGKRRRRGGT
jgi:hypothetical protein